ncbi:hypothetical protein PMZ80_004624 [Knufia obscura]|uniref:Methyltransferase-domain-containing protein n=2 Tax=Knufia TaxID=430999 RepID=A0AAN8F733_9EURO|nr:hypothetical protein PMZ80_004624 [Knufia obscura]KAK5952616.1 hypothetical protein OHC33_006208 [Knufia fluminis]
MTCDNLWQMSAMEKKIAVFVPRRTFKVPATASAFIDVNIAEPDLCADNLTLTTWTSSFVLANQLHKFNVKFGDDEHIPILELGAGTALVGLTAATLWRKKTILTDLPGIVPGLRTNVDLNPAATEAASGEIQCGALDWRKPDILELENGDQLVASKGVKASIIFAADTIYDEEHPELLSNAILTWLARTQNARAILTYALRVAYLDQVREIWTMLEEGGLEAESHGQEQANTKQWEDDDERLCEWVIWRWKTT